jgi:beta-lactamase superfamily II metal-dependent hydrolase
MSYMRQVCCLFDNPHANRTKEDAMKKRNWSRERPKRKWRTPITIFLILFLVFAYWRWAVPKTGTLYPTAELLDGLPTFRFFNVGQGDSTLTVWKGHSILVDAGPTSAGKKTGESVYLYAPNLDLFVVTHPHEDHMGGAAEVLARSRVKTLVLPAVGSSEKYYGKTLDEAEKQGTEVLFLESPMSVELGSIKVDLFPPPQIDPDNLNNDCLLVRIEAGGTSLLITGDAKAKEEAALLSTVPADRLDADYYKVAHHGSSSSNSAAFLAAVSPEICVISVGRNNYGHPDWATLERLAPYTCYRTDQDGTVVLRGRSSD